MYFGRINVNNTLTSSLYKAQLSFPKNAVFTKFDISLIKKHFHIFEIIRIHWVDIYDIKK